MDMERDWISGEMVPITNLDRIARIVAVAAVIITAFIVILT